MGVEATTTVEDLDRFQTAPEELSREESLELLQNHSYVGRVAFIVDDRITILPVNYLGEESSIVFCTGEGSQLSNLRQGVPVAFEVDLSRPLYHSGWSVVVRGLAREVTDQAEILRLRHGPLRSWARPWTGRWIRVSIDEISGRRIPAS